MVTELPQQMHSAAVEPVQTAIPIHSPPHLEVVLHIAVRVLWGVQEDEQVLTQIVGHCMQPRQGGGWQGKLQDLCGWCSGGLDKLQREGFKLS